jgi:hypothetical protein
VVSGSSSLEHHHISAALSHSARISNFLDCRNLTCDFSNQTTLAILKAAVCARPVRMSPNKYSL